MAKSQSTTKSKAKKSFFREAKGVAVDGFVTIREGFSAIRHTAGTLSAGSMLAETAARKAVLDYCREQGIDPVSVNNDWARFVESFD